ncbi:MAG TPA: dihydropteroate synthase [Allosphingosinicella sp.]|jgi:dihydropteroate synthase
MSIYLRPTAFIDSPVGFDGAAMRLAGGLLWFSAVEAIKRDGGQVSRELLSVSAIEAELDRLGEAARAQWRRLTAPRPALELGTRVVRLDQPQVMGIVNATPDSFSGDGQGSDPGAALARAHAMTAAGAAIIDVGGESTRPGAQPVFEGDEEARVMPVVRPLAASGTAVSIDTRKAGIASLALQAGAGMVNDVSALTFDPRTAEVAAKAGCAVVLMHHQGSPETMQQAPTYEGPVALAVYDWLEARIEVAVAAGIAREKIVVDPGIGFGKTVRHNLELMNNLSLLHGLGCPLMVGASRKRTIGALSNEAPADQRLGGSLTLALKAVELGAQIVRVHDVAETVQALRVWRGLRDAALTAG